MQSQISTRYISMRHTSVDGHRHVQQHLVWDAERFVQARQTEAANLNAKQEPGKPRKACAEQITEEQFNKERTLAS